MKFKPILAVLMAIFCSLDASEFKSGEHPMELPLIPKADQPIARAPITQAQRVAAQQKSVELIPDSTYSVNGKTRTFLSNDPDANKPQIKFLEVLNDLQNFVSGIGQFPTEKIKEFNELSEESVDFGDEKDFINQIESLKNKYSNSSGLIDKIKIKLNKLFNTDWFKTSRINTFKKMIDQLNRTRTQDRSENISESDKDIVLRGKSNFESAKMIISQSRGKSFDDIRQDLASRDIVDNINRIDGTPITRIKGTSITIEPDTTTSGIRFNLGTSNKTITPGTDYDDIDRNLLELDMPHGE